MKRFPAFVFSISLFVSLLLLPAVSLAAVDGPVILCRPEGGEPADCTKDNAGEIMGLVSFGFSRAMFFVVIGSFAAGLAGKLGGGVFGLDFSGITGMAKSGAEKAKKGIRSNPMWKTQEARDKILEARREQGRRELGSTLARNINSVATHDGKLGLIYKMSGGNRKKDALIAARSKSYTEEAASQKDLEQAESELAENSDALLDAALADKREEAKLKSVDASLSPAQQGKERARYLFFKSKTEGLDPSEETEFQALVAAGSPDIAASQGELDAATADHAAYLAALAEAMAEQNKEKRNRALVDVASMLPRKADGTPLAASTQARTAISTWANKRTNYEENKEKHEEASAALVGFLQGPLDTENNLARGINVVSRAVFGAPLEDSDFRKGARSVQKSAKGNSSPDFVSALEEIALDPKLAGLLDSPDRFAHSWGQMAIRDMEAASNVNMYTNLLAPGAIEAYAREVQARAADRGRYISTKSIVRSINRFLEQKMSIVNPNMELDDPNMTMRQYIEAKRTDGLWYDHKSGNKNNLIDSPVLRVPHDEQTGHLRFRDKNPINTMAQRWAAGAIGWTEEMVRLPLQPILDMTASDKAPEHGLDDLLDSIQSVSGLDADFEATKEVRFRQAIASKDTLTAANILYYQKNPVIRQMWKATTKKTKADGTVEVFGNGPDVPEELRGKEIITGMDFNDQSKAGKKARDRLDFVGKKYASGYGEEERRTSRLKTFNIAPNGMSRAEKTKQKAAAAAQIAAAASGGTPPGPPTPGAPAPTGAAAAPVAPRALSPSFLSRGKGGKLLLGLHYQENGEDRVRYRNIDSPDEANAILQEKGLNVASNTTDEGKMEVATKYIQMHELAHAFQHQFAEQGLYLPVSAREDMADLFARRTIASGSLSEEEEERYSQYLTKFPPQDPIRRFYSDSTSPEEALRHASAAGFNVEDNIEPMTAEDVSMWHQQQQRVRSGEDSGGSIGGGIGDLTETLSDLPDRLAPYFAGIEKAIKELPDAMKLKELGEKINQMIPELKQGTEGLNGIDKLDTLARGEAGANMLKVLKDLPYTLSLLLEKKLINPTQATILNNSFASLSTGDYGSPEQATLLNAEHGIAFVKTALASGDQKAQTEMLTQVLGNSAVTEDVKTQTLTEYAKAISSKDATPDFREQVFQAVLNTADVGLRDKFVSISSESLAALTGPDVVSSNLTNMLMLAAENATRNEAGSEQFVQQAVLLAARGLNTPDHDAFVLEHYDSLDERGQTEILRDDRLRPRIVENTIASKSQDKQSLLLTRAMSSGSHPALRVAVVDSLLDPANQSTVQPLTAAASQSIVAAAQGSPSLNDETKTKYITLAAMADHSSDSAKALGTYVQEQPIDWQHRLIDQDTSQRVTSTIIASGDTTLQSKHMQTILGAPDEAIQIENKRSAVETFANSRASVTLSTESAGSLMQFIEAKTPQGNYDNLTANNVLLAASGGRGNNVAGVVGKILADPAAAPSIVGKLGNFDTESFREFVQQVQIIAPPAAGQSEPRIMPAEQLQGIVGLAQGNEFAPKDTAQARQNALIGQLAANMDSLNNPAQAGQAFLNLTSDPTTAPIVNVVLNLPPDGLPKSVGGSGGIVSMLGQAAIQNPAMAPIVRSLGITAPAPPPDVAP